MFARQVVCEQTFPGFGAAPGPHRRAADGARASVPAGVLGTVGAMSTPRYRCTACGNLTRFDVTTARRTTAFHHYSVGGELRIEDERVLDQNVERVECRWCGTGSSVVLLADEVTG